MFVFRSLNYVVQVSFSVTTFICLALLGCYCYRHRRNATTCTRWFSAAAASKFQQVSVRSDPEVAQLRADSLESSTTCVSSSDRRLARQPSVSSNDSAPLNITEEKRPACLVEIEEGAAGVQHVANSTSLLSAAPKQQKPSQDLFDFGWGQEKLTLAEVMEKEALLKRGGAGAAV